MRCFFLLALLTQFSTFTPPPASAAVFTSNATIAEAKTNFDGQDIVIDGATVALDGRIASTPSSSPTARCAPSPLRLPNLDSALPGASSGSTRGAVLPPFPR